MESIHNTVENEFFDAVTFDDRKDFFKKITFYQLWYNVKRTISTRGRKSPATLLHEKLPHISLKIFLLHPIPLESIIPTSPPSRVGGQHLPRLVGRNRLITNLLALDERHRALWGEVKQRPELKRILSANADLVAQPLTPEENVSMWQILQQFETGWRVERILNRGELKFLARDIAEVFSYPLPRAVWDNEKQFRNPRFVRFVESALSRKKGEA